MASPKDQDRTEAATPKRREDARKKGKVAVSREIPSVFILFMTLGVFFFLGGRMFNSLSELMGDALQNNVTIPIHETAVMLLLSRIMEKIFWILAPLMIAIIFAGIAANISQFGILISAKPLILNFSKLNPINGLKRLFSLRSLVEIIKAICKILIIGGVAFIALKHHFTSMPDLMHLAVLDILAFIGWMSFKICFYTCLVLMLLAGLDYGFQRWQYEKDLRMTKQEVKEEFKQREGDPLVKARIKRTQVELAHRRMMEAVPLADVVITNPTQLAVALKFDAEDMSAPQVVAKGAGYIAERIKEIAEASGVPIVEQKPLAQTLFKTVQIGEYIPVALYRAVAEVLAYVYRLKRRQHVYSG